MRLPFWSLFHTVTVTDPHKPVIVTEYYLLWQKLQSPANSTNSCFSVTVMLSFEVWVYKYIMWQYLSGKEKWFIQSDMKHTVWSHTPSKLVHPFHTNNDEHMTWPLLDLGSKCWNRVLLEGSLKRFIHSSLETLTQHYNTLVQCYFNLESAATVVFHHTLLAKIQLQGIQTAFIFKCICHFLIALIGPLNYMNCHTNSWIWH